VPVREVSTHASLLSRLKNDDGGDDAWREFDDRYRELIFAFARRLGLQSADADDVAQETLERVRRALPRFDYDPTKGRFRSWLQTAARRATHDRRRIGKDALDRAVAAEAEAEATPDPGADAAWEIEWRRYHVRLATSKARMEFNAKDVAAFEATAVEGRAAAEAAAELGLSVDSVYQAKSRLLKRIRDYVAEQIAEEG
jgi:RNA polymerase sigma factor (sigma-70 family)